MVSDLKHKRGNKGLFTGLVIIAVGLIWLLRKMDIMIPDWIISWQVLIIVIGLGVGVGSNFRNASSWILMGIGLIFLISDIYFIPFVIREYFWPVLVIVIGLILILKPGRGRSWKKKLNQQDAKRGATFADGTRHRLDMLDSVSIFNGIKRMVLSKNFKGGESVTVFGGTEINLIQADIEELAELEVSVVFGGLKLIVPKHWEVRTEVTSVLGGIEDKRFSAVEVLPENKTLLITGIVLFGGIDIVSY